MTKEQIHEALCKAPDEDKMRLAIACQMNGIDVRDIETGLEYISYTDFGGLYNIYTGFTPLYSHIFSPHFGQITNFFTSVVSSLSSGISCCG